MYVQQSRLQQSIFIQNWLHLLFILYTHSIHTDLLDQLAGTHVCRVSICYDKIWCMYPWVS